MFQRGMESVKLSLIIPVYNEEVRVADTIRTLTDYLCAHFPDYELVMVNDGSRDQSGALIDAAAASDPHILAPGYPDNHGKGHAVRVGMLAASGDIRIFTDCDLAYGTDVIAEMAQRFADSGADVIIGSRNLQADGHAGYGLLRRIMSKCYYRLIAWTTGFSHSDSQTGCKGFTGEAAKAVFSKCETDGFAFDLEAILIAEKLGFSVGEMPVKILYNPDGASKIHLVRDTCKMMRDVRKIRRRIKHIQAIPKQNTESKESTS